MAFWRYRAACTLSRKAGVSCSGHPEIACDVTPMAAAALLAVPPKSSMACVFNMGTLKHALFKDASILFCKNSNP